MCEDVSNNEWINCSDSMLMPENLEMLKECVETEICVFRRGNYYTHVMIIEEIDD